MAADEFEGVGQLRGSVTEVKFMLDNGAVVVLLLGGFLRGVGVLAVARGGGVLRLHFFVFRSTTVGQATP